LIEHSVYQYVPAPPPSPKVYPQGGYSHDAVLKRKFLPLDESVFTPTPLRVISIDDKDEGYEEDDGKDTGVACDETAAFILSDPDKRWICLWQDCSQTFCTRGNAKSHVQVHLYARLYEDFNDDTTTVFKASGPSSSRFSYVDSLSDKTPSSRKRFTIRSRARKERITSKSKPYNDASATRLRITHKQIFFPVLSSSTATPDVVPSAYELASSSAQTWPGRGSYCPSRQSPPVPHQEDMETSDRSDDEKADSMKSPLLATFAGRGGKRKYGTRRRLTKAFCGFSRHERNAVS